MAETRTTYRRGLFAQVPHDPIFIPDRRVMEEGTLIGFTAHREPVYTWWNPETEAHECHVIEHSPHVGKISPA